MKRIISLNGQWDFVADLDPKYHVAHTGFHNPDGNRRHWLKAPVPGVWQKYGERYDIFEGVCWFAREFQLDCLPEGATARLRFGGVNYLCRVFLNGQEIGGHEGGYTEFLLNAAGALREGTNHIAVMVDNRATTIKWPPCLGYFNYGGIHRDVTLEIMDGPCLDDMVVQAVPTPQGGMLEVSGCVSGARSVAQDVNQSDQSDKSDSFLPLTVRVEAAGVTTSTIADRNGAFSCHCSVPDVSPWSPDEPNLHKVMVTLDRGGECLDTREYACGFRTVEMRDGRVHLNGAPLMVKGICYVYDSPASGLVMTREQIETDVGLIKELGCNAVRCHYPMDERFYEACDHAGLLVWIEPNVYCYSPPNDKTGTMFARAESRAVAETMIVEMIAAARNHPSVAIYGIGNECGTAHPEAEPFFRRLAALVRETDPTRLVSYAALYGNIGPLADIVDVLGINFYWGWYDQIRQDGSGACRAPAHAGKRPIDLAPMRRMLDEILERNRGTALLLTEFGADSAPGFHSRGRDLWSEEYHADLLREIFAVTVDYPQISGTFPFGFSDYRDPSKIHNGFWNELNLKGVVSYEREKKAAFNAVRSHYGPGRCQSVSSQESVP